MISPTFLQECIAVATQNSQDHTLSPTDTDLRSQSRALSPADTDLSSLSRALSPADTDLSNQSRTLSPSDTDFCETDPSTMSLSGELASSFSSYSFPDTISKVEATLYYAGISRSPPKLVYRTLKDPFVMPKEPEAYRRLKYLCPVYGHKLGDKWEDVCLKIRDLLDKEKVRFSTIDVVRFRTVPDQQIPAATSPVVIWIGVIPDSLADGDARKSANAILALLEDEGIIDVDIEFRESVFRRSAGAELYAPALDTDVTKHFIDPLTTTLGLPIAAEETPDFQGTMGFYFKDGEDLYGVTARHVLFPLDKDNSDYTYNRSAPRKDVLLMGTKAWEIYLNSIKIAIGNLGLDAAAHRVSIRRWEEKVAGGTPAAENAEQQLENVRELLEVATNMMNALDKLFKEAERDFDKPSQRVIGQIVWSPAITVGTAPHSFTKDICVVKLDKARFLPNFKGNVIDLGAC